MLPGGELSSKAHVAGFAFPVKTPGDLLEDWEQAGIGLNDPSQGLQVQLWHLEAKPNDDTGDIDCIVDAPSIVPLVLFSGADITEVALAFDQNMNPFVAYMQGGVPKIYWFDPLIPGMTHTDLPAGCRDLRCTLDDKRDFAVSDSDIVLGYINDGNLCARYQSDRYLIEHVLKEGAGPDANLVSMAMNREWRMQFRLRNYALTDDPGALLQADPFLADVVADLLRRSNVPPEYIDTDQLWVPIEGYRIANEGGADSNIAPLQQAWFFDPGEWDKKLRFIMRGAEPVAHITFSDLLERQGNNGPMQMERVQEIELLRKVNLTTVDSTAGWIGSKQTAERRSATIKATGESSTILPITMHPDFAATIATKRLRIPWGELHKFRYGLGVPWSMLTPTDVITYEDTLGRVHQIRLGQIEEDYGSFQYESTTNARWIYDLTATGTSAPPWIPTTPGQAGDTVLEIINAPVNREADDELGLYIAARGTGSAWSSGVLLVSTDGGANYVQAATLDAPATIGETESAMSGSATTVDVVVPDPLESVTDDQIAVGNNRAFIGDEEVQFKTATLTLHDDDGYHYTLSGMVRNVLRTTAVAHSAGSRFVLFDDAVVFMLVGRTFYDTDVKYKAVTNGQNADDVAEVTYHLKPMYSQIEWAVKNVTVTAADGGGVKVTWNGSPRIGTFGANPFHSKYMIGYRVKFSDGHTIETTDETVTYAAGTMGSVVEVRALNSITGEGPLADGSGEVDPGDVPTFLFSGSLPDGYVGIPYDVWNGECGIVTQGGMWDANARGVVVPGVMARNTSDFYLDQFKITGIPYQAGTFTTKVYVDATSPDPLKNGSQNINQSVTIYPKPTYSLLDLRFKQHAYGATMNDTTPPMKEFSVFGSASFAFYGVTTGKVVGQFKITGSTKPVIVGINNLKGELTVGDNAVGIGPLSPGGYAGTAGTYSVELDADSGDFWIYKDGTGLVKSGTLSLGAGKQYRICCTTEYVQSFTLEANGGNEAWFMSVTQPGHGGIPMPNIPIPLAWGTIEPDYVASGTGNGGEGIVALIDVPNSPNIAKSNAAYASGKHRWSMGGGARVGICVPSFSVSDGQLGDPSTPDSVGWNPAYSKLYWSLNGSSGNMPLPMPAAGIYPLPIFALDADNDTLKICGQTIAGEVVVLQTVDLPAGKTWHAAQSGAIGGSRIYATVPGPAGYDDAVVA